VRYGKCIHFGLAADTRRFNIGGSLFVELIFKKLMMPINNRLFIAPKEIEG
jgi:hypothetical protein